ncbi:MAG TPA: hypothetical protein VGC76_17695 [Pyrinomonadaceae bacterium]|jgi:hypothetical protein
MEEREMMKDDARLICEKCIRITANFHGEIKPGDSLGFLGVDNSRIEPLKERIIGAVDPEIGVTRFFYKLDIDMLATAAPGTTVSKLTDLVFAGSIPDMTHTRALMVIRGCIFVALGSHIPAPQSSVTLKELAIDTAALLKKFNDAIRNNQQFGVRSFKRLIEESKLVSVSVDTTVGDLILILKNDTIPAFI